MDIKVDHISKAYGEQQVLQDLSCVFRKGKPLVSEEDPDVAKQH